MHHEFFSIENKRFLSSKKAGRDFNYTSDYIARLCRQGVLHGRMVGRTWYVEEGALLAFIAEREAEREMRQTVLMETRRKEYRKARLFSVLVLEPLGKFRCHFSSHRFEREIYPRAVALSIAVLLVSSGMFANMALHSFTGKDVPGHIGQALKTGSYSLRSVSEMQGAMLARATYRAVEDPSRVLLAAETLIHLPAELIHSFDRTHKNINTRIALLDSAVATASLDTSRALSARNAASSAASSAVVPSVVDAFLLTRAESGFAVEEFKIRFGEGSRSVAFALQAFSLELIEVPDALLRTVSKFATGVYRTVAGLEEDITLAFRDKEQQDHAPFDGERAYESSRTGIVVKPSEGADKDAAFKKKIQDSFSDEVKVVPDETGRSGIIQPVFKKSEGEPYVYMLVPIE